MCRENGCGESVTRLVLALLLTAVGASLLIGTAFAKGPVPENPPDLPPVILPPAGAEEVLVFGVPTKVRILSEVTSNFQITSQEDAAFYGAALMTEIEINCRLDQHTFRHSEYKLAAKLRFCYNVTNPPNLITSHDRYEASGTTEWPLHRIIGEPWHHKSGGGAGHENVKTKAKATFCTLQLQDDNTFICPFYTNLYIDATHRVGGESTSLEKVTMSSVS